MTPRSLLQSTSRIRRLSNMVAPYFPLVQIDGHSYYPRPYSEPRLTSTVRWGMVPIAVLATLSVASTITLIGFILSRFMSWKSHYRTFVGHNQYVVLVLNLLIADLQQSAAFLIEWHWFRKNLIVAPSAACFAQGWLLHSGDVSRYVRPVCVKSSASEDVLTISDTVASSSWLSQVSTH